MIFLTLKRRAGGRLVFSPSLAYRAGFALIFAVALFVAFFGSLFEGEPTPFAPSNIAPLLFVLASGIALLYCDAWIFDRDGGVVENQFGLVLLFARKRFPLASLRSLQIESFRKGRAGVAPRLTAAAEGARRGLHARVNRLVATVDGREAHILDTARAVHAAAMERTGRRIAEYCGVSFETGP